MKKFGFLTVLFFFCLLSDAMPQAFWEKVPVPTKKSLNALVFTDSLYGWVAGDSGTMLHTRDGGRTWVLQQTGSFNDISSVFFLDRQRGFASSYNFRVEPYGTILLKTVDGGQHWDTSTYPVHDVFMQCIYYLDSLNGWMGGTPHALVRTTDGGRTWTQASIDTSQLAFFPVEYITFYNKKHGYASGGIFDVAGVIWSTHDYGNHWKAIDPSQAPADQVHALYCFDSTHVMGAGGDPDFGYGVGMIRTADGGATWAYQELGVQGNAWDLAFRTGEECWAPLGSRRLLIYSLDRGLTWTTVIPPDTAVIMKICFPDSVHGFGAGRDGTVIRYLHHSSGLPKYNPVEADSRGVTLLGNQPNPFRDDTRVLIEVNPSKGTLPEAIQLKVFSVMGRECLSSEVISPEPGRFELKLNTGNLNPGIYFCQVFGRAGNVFVPLTSALKMIRVP